MRGEPQDLFIKTQGGRYELNQNAVEEVFNRENVKNLPICVIAFAGASRKGKTSLLNSVLRYFQRNGNADWMQEDEVPEGFPQSHSGYPQSEGVVVWSEPFIVKEDGSIDSTTQEYVGCVNTDAENSKKVAVFLMDTVGSFSGDSMKDFVQIFGFIQMVSSILVYDMNNQINSNDLNHLQYFQSFTKEHEASATAAISAPFKPFQSLVMLIRDWDNPVQLPYGLLGGRKHVQQWIQSSDHHVDKKNPNSADVKKDLVNSYRDIDCFLLPPPVDKDSTYKREVRAFVENMCKKENLVVKQNNIVKVTAGDYNEHLKLVADHFSRISDKAVPVGNLISTVVCNSLMDEALRIYAREMEWFTKISSSGSSNDQFENAHAKAVGICQCQFKSGNKFSRTSPALYSAYYQKMMLQINEKKSQYFCLHQTTYGKVANLCFTTLSPTVMSFLFILGIVFTTVIVRFVNVMQ